MDKTMNDNFLFYYNQSKENEANDFFIRGIGLHEKMRPRMVRHGNERYPWLFIYFHSPAVVRTPSGVVKCDHSLIVWEPRQLHDYGNEINEWDHSWLIVQDPSIRQLLNPSLLPLNMPMNVEAGEIFEKYLALLYQEITRPAASRYLMENFLKLFLFEINRIMEKQNLYVSRKLQEIEQYMNQHLDRQLSIGNIADRFHISPSHLMARFKEYSGISLMHYLNRKRMERAAFLLQNYPYSCKEVSEMTGFANQLYFSRRFRAFWGVPPKEFKEKHRQMK
jgi:AraC-like DNA-binding protein